MTLWLCLYLKDKRLFQFELILAGLHSIFYDDIERL